MNSLFNLKRDFPSNNICGTTGILPLRSYVLIWRVTLLYKILNGYLISDINRDVCRLNQSYNTRNVNELIVPRVITTRYGSNGTLFSLVRYFNLVPSHILCTSSIYSFWKNLVS